MRKLVLTFLLFCTLRVSGQISVLFVPEINGRTTEGLFGCRILNPFQKQTATLTITVSERSQGTVLIVKTPQFTIAPGSNPLPLSIARGATIQFSNNKIGSLIRVNHILPEGDYEYCFSLTYVHSDNPPDEQCFNYTLTPFAELNLIDPYNKDKICDKRPLLTWQPLIPGVPGAYYQLVLTQVNSGQSPTEALNYNLPLINQSNIISPVLPYPSVARDLVTGKTYAWQVTAYKDQTVLNRSEVWSFIIDCQDSVKKVNEVSFRDIEDLARGNYYIAEGAIRFATVNAYAQQDLRYEIAPVNAPDRKVGKLPKLKLKNGTNQLTIDLSNSKLIRDNQYYILTIWLPNGTIKNLRFLYREVK